MPDEDKPVPLRPATSARSRLRPVPAVEPEADPGDEVEGPAAPRLLDRIQELAERIEEETAASQATLARESEIPARAVREAAAKHAESAAQRMAESHGRHEAPAPLPPLPLPADAEPEAVPVRPGSRDPQPEGEPAAVQPGPDAPAKTVKKAPARKPAANGASAAKAATKKAPAKKAAKAPAKKTAAKAPAKKAAAGAAVAKAGAAPVLAGEPSAVRRGVPAPPARPLPRPVVAATDAVPAPHPYAVVRTVAPATVVPERGRGRLGRVLVVLSVLLLAAAAGLGIAAFVMSGEQTWESRVAVRLVPGPVPTTDPSTSVKNGIDRYTERVPGLTLTTAEEMGIPQEDVRGAFEVVNPEPDVIGIIVHTAHRNQAALLASAAASELIKTVNAGETANVTSAADRLSPVVTNTVTNPERTRPDPMVAALAGGLAALAVLLVAGLVSVVRRAQR